MAPWAKNLSQKTEIEQSLEVKIFTEESKVGAQSQLSVQYAFWIRGSPACQLSFLIYQLEAQT